MKNIYPFYLFAFVLFVFVGCKKKVVLPNITTLSVSNIFATEATSGGVISSQGTGNILSRGVVWSTSQNPTISLSTKTSDSSGVGTFSSKLYGLSANTKYYVRAYATVASGTSYGNEVSFTTNDIDLKKGLVAYYPFTGNAGDSSGNGNHGLVNGATLTTDRFSRANKAYQFSENIITVPHIPSLGFTQDKAFSLSFWALRTGTQGTQHFIGKRSPRSQSFNWQVAFNIGSNEGLLFSGNVNFTSFGAVSGKDFAINKWTNLICIYNSNNWQLFENGILISSKISTLFYNDVNTPMTIGNSGNF